MGSKPSTPRAKSSTIDVTKDKNGKGNKTEKPDLKGPEKTDLKGSVDVPKDVMISYSHQDKEMMARLRESLENNGITVWVDVAGLQAGVDFLGKIGQAILDAKLFISLLSTSSVTSKYCQDEVALAYVSQKAIFPFAINTQQEVYACMGTGMRLQLSGIEWTFSLKPETFEEDFAELLSRLKMEIEAQKTDEKTDVSAKKSFQRQISKSQKKKDPKVQLNAEDYWKNHYNKDLVEWERFKKDFSNHYKEQIATLFINENEEQDFLWRNLKPELELLHDEDSVDMLLKENLIGLTTQYGDTLSLWNSVEAFIKEMFAIEEVFGMDSSVRVQAIEHLGQFQSPRVIESLRDLMYNEDANVRAVASVSLAKTGNSEKLTIKRLMKSLNDKDRLVREAGCLALGHIKAKEAVPTLLRIWRNDFISHVREAAQAALELIGGEEVEQAMHITKVLADEIRLLTQEN
ncbi:protein tirA-like [Argopecten irradians]|uniref:protein tirA-like n=1 Tax=Argopecten irradians TaxID=31199 RepID=UPI00371BA80A